MLAGDVGSRLREVADCPASGKRAVLGPAVSEGTVAWRGCGGQTVEIDADGRRSTLAASGTPVALATAGRLVGWIAARSGNRRAVVELADLDTGKTVSVGEVPAVSPTATASLLLTAAGRLRAGVGRVDDQANIYCESFSANLGGPLEDRGRGPYGPAASRRRVRSRCARVPSDRSI